MDEKRRSKRKSMDDGFWDCSVCTYRNTPEAFKCEMCDVRKGTSTRKPRLNPQLVAQQVAQQFPAPVLPKKEKSGHRDNKDNDRDIEMKYANDSLDDSRSSSTEVSPKVEMKPSKEEKVEKKTPVAAKELPKEPVAVKDNKTKTETTPASTSSTPRSRRPTKLTQLKNIDRSTGRSMEVTVGDVTVIITDYKPKKEKEKTDKNSSITTDQDSNPGVTPVGTLPANSNHHMQPSNDVSSTNS